jgi:hypothetical protein
VNERGISSQVPDSITGFSGEDGWFFKEGSLGFSWL